MPDRTYGATLSRALDISDIPPEGLEGRIEASADERAELARRLDLTALDALEMSYTLNPAGRGRFRLTGHWRADATQICGVTLDPIARAYDEPVSLEFWPSEVWERHISDSGEITIDPEEEMPELIDQGMIDPGHLLEELLIVSLPPFPRRENAVLEWQETGAAPESPFAVLKDLPKRNGTPG